MQILNGKKKEGDISMVTLDEIKKAAENRELIPLQCDCLLEELVDYINKKCEETLDIALNKIKQNYEQETLILEDIQIAIEETKQEKFLLPEDTILFNENYEKEDKSVIIGIAYMDPTGSNNYEYYYDATPLQIKQRLNNFLIAASDIDTANGHWFTTKEKAHQAYLSKSDVEKESEEDYLKI